jgi:hypothetical protein
MAKDGMTGRKGRAAPKATSERLVIASGAISLELPLEDVLGREFTPTERFVGTTHPIRESTKGRRPCAPGTMMHGILTGGYAIIYQEVSQ